MPIRWNHSLEIGIPVIDNQHKRIVAYVNKLEHAHAHQSREELGEVLDEVVDYTLSHFAFEESLMEESGYPFLGPHRRVHELFTRRVADYQQRFKLGEDVAEDLLHTLTAWLINHIQSDDKDYGDAVRAHAAHVASKARKGGFFSRLFR